MKTGFGKKSSSTGKASPLFRKVDADVAGG